MLEVLTGQLESLIPHSRAPKRKRKRQTLPEIVMFIESYRKAHPGIGKEAIKPACDAFCLPQRIKSISTSTIGRVLNDLKRLGLISEIRMRLSLNAVSGKLHERLKKPRIKKEQRNDYSPSTMIQYRKTT